MTQHIRLARLSDVSEVAPIVKEGLADGILEPVRALDAEGHERLVYMLPHHLEARLSHVPANVKERATYIVITTYGGDPWTSEMKTEECTRARTIENIFHCQYERIQAVHAYDLRTGRCWDATREIAEAVRDRAAPWDGEPLTGPAFNFVMDQLGIMTAQSMGRG